MITSNESNENYFSNTMDTPEDPYFIKLQKDLIRYFWSAGINIQNTGNKNTDYGEHFTTLNFPRDASLRKPSWVGYNNLRPNGTAKTTTHTITALPPHTDHRRTPPIHTAATYRRILPPHTVVLNLF